MKNLKKVFILNITIGVFEILSLIWMMSGVNVFSTGNTLTAARFQMFKYFTVDSNFIMLIVAVLASIYDYLLLKKKINKFPILVYILKLLGVTGLSLTMIVTILFLAPTMGLGVVFTDSNLFLHVINPLMSILTFILFEKTTNIKFKHTFTACLPVFLYAIYYVLITLLNTKNGVILPGYDWYGFFFLGLKSIVIVLPIIFIVTYVISYLIWNFNRK